MNRLRDFLDEMWDDIGLVILLALVLSGLGALIWYLDKQDDAARAHKAQVCVEAMQMARTSADSITVKLRCDLPELDEGATTVVPMPIIIPAR